MLLVVVVFCQGVVLCQCTCCQFIMLNSFRGVACFPAVSRLTKTLLALLQSAASETSASKACYIKLRISLHLPLFLILRSTLLPVLLL